ncbi:MAG: hypothetical protein QOC99_2734 [Acidobacteriota bacterium]|jgi:Flp pilus assembly protein TadD|nr:hypothetical protein [Acidobacteriota bacterium]MDT7780222.1 hypothetical protein [Acidobacteriota bacterium]
MSTQKILKSSRVSFVALAAVCAALLFSATASMQAKKPITKQGLMNAVKINGLSTQELVQQIERRGVDFEMTASDESDLRGVGARPEIIEAARASYHPAAATPAVVHNTTPVRPPNSSNAGPVNANVPDGPPLSKSEIVTMLQGGINPARVEQFVEKRGVNFQVTPEIAREITAAGGNRSLVGAITEKSTTETASTNRNDSPFAGNNGTPANNAPDYDDLIDHANSSAAASDYPGAIRYAQQAAQLDPQQPTAYSILGTIALYYSQNVSTAEQAMRAAIERGGAAAFHVYHDHDGSFTSYCEGSFFVTKTGVSFKANDGRDTFDAEDSNIKEAKSNAFMGAQYGAFHIKPVQKINGRDNFNFAPNSRSKAEAELIIRLIKGY